DKRVNIVFESANAAGNSVNIYNLTGAKVFSSKLAQTGFNNTTLDLSTLGAGVYVLEFASGDYKAVRKIVLQ
ncbi:MAG: T9SS type A sorting domain-containing protein, partial [Chitinophagaceae bacterium]